MGEEQIIEEQFPEVVRLNAEQKLEELNFHKSRLTEMVALIDAEDSELLEAITGVVSGIIWLKEHHDKEGSLSYRYTKKKNVRDASEAKISIQATFKEPIDETETKTTTKEFLDKEFIID